MNNRGFTLVEILGVIIVLGLVFIIATPLVSNAGKNAKIKLLQTKVNNIEKAAVLYAQGENIKFDEACNSTEDDVCYGISNCKCNNINVKTLLDKEFINKDDATGLINPVDETQHLNECKIKIYKKYGKIYAHYVSEGANDATCWVEE